MEGRTEARKEGRSAVFHPCLHLGLITGSLSELKTTLSLLLSPNVFRAGRLNSPSDFFRPRWEPAHTLSLFFYLALSFSLVGSFLLFFLLFLLLFFINHLFPHLPSAYATILLHEIFATHLFRDFEVRSFRDAVLKFCAFVKTLYFESLCKSFVF